MLKERAAGGQFSTREYTDRDVDLLLSLERYEASLCPGGEHVLAETSKPEYEDAYRPDTANKIRCFHCKGQHVLSESLAKQDDTAGLFIPLMLDADVVKLNLLPVPPLPPELLEADVP